MNYRELLSANILSTKISQKSESLEDRTQKMKNKKFHMINHIYKANGQFL